MKGKEDFQEFPQFQIRHYTAGVNDGQTGGRTTVKHNAFATCGGTMTSRSLD